MTHDRASGADQHEHLRRIAAGKLHTYGRDLVPGQRAAAVALLADLYAAGLRHGITPETWAAVAGLDIGCIDAIRWRDRVNRPNPRAERPFGRSLQPSRCRSHEPEGRELS